MLRNDQSGVLQAAYQSQTLAVADSARLYAEIQWDGNHPAYLGFNQDAQMKPGFLKIEPHTAPLVLTDLAMIQAHITIISGKESVGSGYTFLEETPTQKPLVPTTTNATIFATNAAGTGSATLAVTVYQ